MRCNCTQNSTDFNDLWMADRTAAQGLLSTNQPQLAFSWSLSDLHVLVLDAPCKQLGTKLPFTASYTGHSWPVWRSHGHDSALTKDCWAHVLCGAPAWPGTSEAFAGDCCSLQLTQALFSQGVMEGESDEVPPADRLTCCQANLSVLSWSWRGLVSQYLDWLRKCKAEKCLAALCLLQHSDC